MRHVWSGSPDPSAPYTAWSNAAHAVQEAVDAAAEGDTVLITNGVYVLGSQVTITNGIALTSVNGARATSLDGNHATRCLLLNHSNAVVQGVTLTNGYRGAESGGGALCLAGILQNSILAGNSAPWGGGVHAVNSARVRSCLIHRNTATIGGGGGLFEGGATAENCTVADNSSQFNYGGGVVTVGASVTLLNCILWSNSAPANPNWWYESGGNAAYTNCCTVPLVGVAGIPADPLFVARADANYRLQSGSPCLDNGANLAWMPGATDVAGKLRLQDGNNDGTVKADVGAYEHGYRYIGPWRGACAVSAGAYYTLALRTNGALAGWGDNTYGRASPPAPNTNFVSVSANYNHALGLRADGTIVAWGDNTYGQTNVPAPNADFMAVAAGGYYSMGLKSDGTIVAWGDNGHGQTNVPAPNADFVALAGGQKFALGLKADGSVVAWGRTNENQCTVPAPNSGFVGVAAGDAHALGLKADGSIAAWGYSDFGLLNVPAPNAGFVAVARGYYHCLGMKAGGTVTGWGIASSGQCSAPAPNTNFTAVSGGMSHSAGLKTDGTLLTWGDNSMGQLNTPTPNSGFGSCQGGGVVPSSGTAAGGTTVTIFGMNLCDGADVTNVTLCGVSATIVTATASRILAITGAGSPGSGDIAVYSARLGMTVKSNAFTYTGTPAPAIAVLGTNGATVANGEAASAAKGTDFGHLLAGAALTNTLSVTNAGGTTLSISGMTVSGVSSSAFQVLNWPATVAAGAAGNFAVRYAPTAIGLHDAALLIVNDATNYTVNLRGSGAALSMTAGPFAGGNALTITNGTLGSGSDITNVLVGGVAATITGQSVNWVTIIAPTTGSAGVKDIVIQSASAGVTTLPRIYSVNPAGQIGSVTEDWTRWQEVAGLPAARYAMAAAVMNGALYAIGGSDGSTSQTNVYRYGGSSWTEVAGLPAARQAAAAGVLGGILRVVGGYDGTNSQSSLYENGGLNWSQVGSLPEPRHALAVGVLSNELYALGGYYNEAQGSVYRYDGWTWTTVAGMPAARDSLGAGVLGGALYAVGGTDNSGAHANVYRYDGVGWTEVAGLPVALSHMAVAVLNEQLYAIGGSSSTIQTNVYRYNGTNWTEVAGLPAARFVAAAGVLNGVLYAVGGHDGTSAKTNVYRYPGLTLTLGVIPSSGSVSGGYPVTITGSNLGSGTDITNVTLCGVSVGGIVSQSATQVVVTAGAGAPGLGNVAVFSIGHGVTVKSNAFTYTLPGIAVLGTNGATVANGEGASAAKGTDFGHLLAGAALTNTLSVTNAGGTTLSISGMTVSGVSSSAFQVLNWPATVAAGAAGNFAVRYAPTAVGLHDAALLIVNDATNYTVNLRGSAAALSMTAGPFAGGNVLTITNGTLGSGSDITNVLVGGVAATITGQSVNWVTIIAPTTGSAGVKDIVIQSASAGVTTLPRIYTVNPAGQIGGMVPDWTQWQEVTGLPAARYGMAAGVLNDALYAFGGSDGSIFQANVYRYDGTNWTEVAALPAARHAAAAGVLGGALYAMGGYDGGTRSNVYRYNGANWTEVAGLPGVRQGLAAGVLNNSLYAGGGYYMGPQAGMYRYDGTNWTDAAGLPSARDSLGAGVLNGALYAVGGTDSGGAHTNVYRYDGIGWTEVAGLPVALSHMAVAVLNEQLYAIGGSSSTIQTNVYRYNGTNWTEVAGLPAARFVAAAGVLNGVLYAVGGHDGSSAKTNVYRYPGLVVDFGVSPSSGNVTGGYPVIITGTNLGSGGDITNVTLCGVSVAGIVSQSATQVVVTAAPGSPGSGDIAVYSACYGMTVKSNAFTYTGTPAPAIAVLGTNGATVANGEAASAAKGTDFGHLLTGASLTNTLSITNAGGTTLSISGMTVSGVSSSVFQVLNWPATVAAGAAGNFVVRYAPTALGLHDAALLIANDATNYTVNLRGSAVGLSMTAGPFAGGNVLTITNGTLGSGSDITNVLIGGAAAAITGQGIDWVTINAPATGSAGAKDVVIQSASAGATMLPGAYKVNPEGHIGHAPEDWTQWEEVAGLPGPRFNLAAGVRGNSIYAFGGHDGTTDQSSAHSYDGTTWTQAPSLPAARNMLAAGALNGSLYAVGGFFGGSNQFSVYRFDGSIWTAVASLPTGRRQLGVGVLNGALYAVGGVGGNEALVFRYDGTNWTIVNGLPYGRHDLAVGVLDDAMYAVGGLNSSGVAQTNVFRYDGTNWMEVAGLPAARSALRAGVLNGALYAVGGNNSGGIAQTNVFRYDGTNWMEVAGLPAARSSLAVETLNGALYAVGGYEGSAGRSNVYRYPRVVGFDPGVSPSEGSAAGGYPVTITGSNLGNGADITNVTLCGVSVAGIVSQSATQVVVTAAAGAAGPGDVAVYSIGYGVTSKSNAFTYIALPAADIRVLGTNGAAVVNGEAASTAKGTDFGHLLIGASLTNTLFITNSGEATLTISGIAVSGVSSSAFQVLTWPDTVVMGGVRSFTVRYAPGDAGVDDAVLLIANNATNYTVNLRGSAAALSMTAGPLAGGNALTITNGALGNGSDITNVLVGGVAATIAGQGVDWVTILMPATGSAGVKNIAIHSVSVGVTTLRGGYTVNPAGQIFGVVEDWTQWQEVAGLPGPRFNVAAGVLNGALYAIGGHDGTTDQASVHSYAGTTWTQATPLPAARNMLAAGVLNGALYAIGGYEGVYQANVYRYDGTNWSEVAALPEPRSKLAVGVLNGGLYAIGGHLVNVVTNVYRYNGTNWTEVAGLPDRRFQLGVGVLNGVLYAVGGFDGFSAQASTYRYDGTTWTNAAGLPAARYGLGAGVLNGALYAVGGTDGSTTRTNVYRFNGTNWTEVAGLPAARSSLAVETLNGALYAVGGYDGSAGRTNAYRYPRIAAGPGVSPTNGSVTGGYPVTITGTNLGSGADITNVTLCGVSVAGIVSQSATQVVVTAAPGAPGPGDVAVYSIGYGVTSKSNAFTYIALPAANITVLGTNGAAVANGEAASTAKGTDFGHLLIGASLTNTLSITNSGEATLTISGIAVSGVSSSAFQVLTWPGTVAAGGVSNFTVRYTPISVGVDDAVLLIANDATNYTVNLRGSAAALSMTAGPFAGGNALTITNGALGNGSDITNVLVGGVAATITGQGADWVTILAPATGSTGVKDIVIQSASVGAMTLPGGYTVNPAGQIGGVVEDWTRWQEVAGLPARRNGLAAAALNGDLYAMGGHNGSSFATNVYRFDGTGWSEVAGLPAARMNLAAAVFNGALYALGGHDGSARTNVYRYDGTSWSEVAGLPAARSGAKAVTFMGALYVVGGVSGSSVYTNVYRYDGTSWTEVAGLPGARAYEALGVVEGSLCAAGGMASGGGLQTSLYRFDGTNWTSGTAMPDTRDEMGDGVLNGALYVIGGNSGHGLATNVFRYEGTNWTQVAGLPAAVYTLAGAACGGGLYAVGGMSTDWTPRTNVYRYPRMAGFTAGVSPSEGSAAGGYPVTITGSNLGSGGDITNVTLCGVSVAGIVSQSATQVVVTAAAGAPGTGDVAVYSIGYGVTSKSNAFTYTALPAADIRVLGTNGAAVANGEAATAAKGTDFGHLLIGASLTNTLSITNSGEATLTISGMTVSGVSSSAFQVLNWPAMVPAGGVSNFTVRYAPGDAGVDDAALLIANNATNYTVNLRGSTVELSMNSGPFAGGNAITITNGALGNGSDITNVLVGGVAATITGQGADWVTILAPATGSAGVKNIAIHSVSVGVTTLPGGYTVNPAGQIGGAVEDWTRWQEVAGLPGPRFNVAAGVLNGALYAVGGHDGTTDQASVHSYAGTTWTQAPPLPVARNMLAAGTLNGALYAIGGHLGTAVTNVYRYNGTNWSEVAGLPEPRSELAVGMLNGALYAIGGNWGTAVTNVYRYNGTNWTEVAGLPDQRLQLAAGVLNGALYAVGGHDGSSAHASTYRYDGTTWTNAAGLPVERYGLKAGLLNGALYAVGGNNSSGIAQTNVFRFDGTNWTEVAGLPAARASLAVETLNGALYAVGGYEGSAGKTNAYRYPRIAAGPGVSPTNGSVTGGYPVTITGTNLGSGADITNVTLCGVSVAGIVSQSATQVVVTAAAGAPGTGDVAVYSIGYGVTSKSNAFTYTALPAADIRVLGTNGAAVANGEAASAAKGTDFGHLPTGASLTHALSITNPGAATLTISGMTVSGVSSSAFQVLTWPGTVTAGGVSNFTVRYTPISVGVDDAVLLIANDATNYMVNLRGSAAALSMTAGPFAGGNGLTITNGALGNGSDITNVLVGGVAATITGQGADWVTILAPATGSAGVKDIVIQSASAGVTTLPGGYTVNPAGQIGGAVEDWTRWQEVAGLPARRNGLAAAALNGDLYAMGGHNGSSFATNVYRFDGTGWSEVAGLPAARMNLAAAVFNGALYALGGHDGSARTNVYRYDGTSWSEVAGLPAARSGAKAVTFMGALYVVGGISGSAVYANVYRYDGTSWTEVAGLPGARAYEALGVVDGSLCAAGGMASDGGLQTSLYRFDGTNWTSGTAMPDTRDEMGDGVLNGALYVIGGNSGHGLATNVFRYEGTNWTQVAGLPAAVYTLAGAAYNGGLYAVGGMSTDWTPRTNVYRYPRMAGFGSGVSPAGGGAAGGYPVTITGSNLGNGADITNVTLCGVSVAGIVSQSATQVVVTAAPGSPGVGTVTVFSTTYGTTAKSSAFTYFGPPTVETGPVTGITATNAMGGGDVVSDGGDPVTARGLCWGTTTHPTLADAVAASGSGTGAFSGVAISDLLPATLYHVRAWATNSTGVGYGSDAPFGTACRIVASAGPHGSVSPSGSVEVAYGGTMEFTAAADAYFHIGTLSSNGTTVAAAVNERVYTSVWGNVTATGVWIAAFAENLTTNTATPEWWLAAYGWTGGFESAAANDADGDSVPTWAEYPAGTDPTNKNSFLGFSGTTQEAGGAGAVVRWLSVDGKFYRLERGTNLMDCPPFGHLVRTNIPGTAPMNTETDKTAVGRGPWFYRVKVE